VSEDLRDRAAGSIIGLAIGDALGAPFEYRRRTEIPDPLPAFEEPWMGLPPGTWTDDTAMARNLWTSLIEERGAFEPDDVLDRHLRWLATDPPDVGNQTRAALLEAMRGTPEAARAIFERRGPEVSAGNGSAMYCAPLGVAA
jgi:ADP-ribosyl-[dinitrogen reductase] hydrolase